MVKQYRKPHRFKKRKPIYRQRFFWLGLLILISLSSLFYFLFFAEFFQVEKINLSGLEQVSQEDLNLLIQEKLENRILFFPTRSIFLMDLNKIKEDILGKFPQIAKVEIKRSFPRALDFLVTEREGLAIFCQEGEEDKSSSLNFADAQVDNCFVLDKEGIIFEERLVSNSSWPVIRTLTFTAEINPGEKVVKEDKSSFPPFAAARVVEKEDLVSILEINSQLKENLNIPIEEFVISSREKLIVLTSEGWELYFNLQENIEWQLTKLKALLEEKIPSEKRQDLEYIELRFGNFANPKYKD